MPPKATTPKNFKAIKMINRAIQAKGGTKIPPHLRKPFTLGLYNVYQGYNNNIAIAPNQQVVPISQNEPLPIEAPPTSSGNMDELSRYSGISDIFRDSVAGASRDSHVLGNMDTQEAPDAGARVVSQGGVMPGSASSNGTLVQSIPPAITGTHGRSRHTYRTVNHFCIPVTTNTQPQFIMINQTPCLNTQMIVIPWKSAMMYMTYYELCDLMTKCSKWRPLSAKIKLGNFTTHTGNLSATGSTHIAMNYNGVMYESIMGNMEDLGPYYFTQGNSTPLDHGKVAQAFSAPQRSIAVAPYNFYYNQGALIDQFSVRIGVLPSNNVNVQTNRNGTDLIKFPKINERVTLQLNNPKHTELNVKLDEDWISEYQSIHYARACGNNGNNLDGTNIDGSNAVNQFGGQNNFQIGPYYKQGQSLHRRMGGTRYSQYGVNICSKPNVQVIGRTRTFQHNTNQGAGILQDLIGQMDVSKKEKTPDVWAFRVVPPPTIDGTDPNIMIQFTIEAELEVEYEDLMGDAHEKYVFYGKPISDANTAQNWVNSACSVPYGGYHNGAFNTSQFYMQLNSEDMLRRYYQGVTYTADRQTTLVDTAPECILHNDGYYNCKNLKNVPNVNTVATVDDGYQVGAKEGGFTAAVQQATLQPSNWGTN